MKTIIYNLCKRSTAESRLIALLFCLPMILPACSLTSCSPEKKASKYTASFKIDNPAQLVLLESATTIADSKTRSNLLAIDSTGVVKSVINSVLDISISYAVLSPDKKNLYLELATTDGGLKYINQESCSFYRIELATSQSFCVLRNYTTNQWNPDAAAWSSIKNNLLPIQFDQQQNVYVQAQKFLRYCDKDCQTGDDALNYHRIENNQGDGFYVQNQQQIFRLGPDNSQQLITLKDTNLQAFAVMANNKLALLSSSDNVNQLNIWHEGKILSTQPVAKINSLLLDDQGSLLINNEMLLKVNDAGLVLLGLAKTALRTNSNLQLGVTGEILDLQGSLLYKSLPFEARPIAQLQASDNELIYASGYAFEKVQDNLIFHDALAYSSTDFKNKVGGLDGYTFSGKPFVTDSIFYQVVIAPEKTASYLLSIKLQDFSQQPVIESVYTKTQLNTGSTGGVKRIINFQTTQEDSHFYLNKVYALAENPQALSLEFSKVYSPSIAEHIALKNPESTNVNYFGLYFRNYFHLMIDADGLDNNLIVNESIQNIVPLENNATYQLTVSNSLTSLAGDALVDAVDTISYPKSHQLTIAPESGVYHSTLTAFNRQFPAISEKVAQGGVIAKPVCKTEECSGFYYNLGLTRTGNVRLEFSSSSDFVQLALWDSYRYAQSYNRRYAPIYAFWADALAMNFKNYNTIVSQPFSDLGNTQLADPQFWRRYRLDFYGSHIRVSWSLDGKQFTLVDSFSIDDADNFVVNNNEYFWLMEFDGAIDNLRVSSLNFDGDIIFNAGDLLQENFAEQVAFIGDNDPDNFVGFEENIIDKLPLPEAGSGSPDSSYGSRGITAISPEAETSGGRLQRLLVDANGNSYIAGRVFYGTEVHFALWKYNSNGQRDMTFADNGVFIERDVVSEPFDIALGSDNKLYIAGIAYNDIDTDVALWRFNLDGSRDVSFNNTGLVTNSSSEKEAAFSLEVNTDKVFLGGYSKNGMTIWSYDALGNLNTNFNGNGILTITGETSEGQISDVSMDNSGKLLLVGYQKNANETAQAVLFRITTSGVLDGSVNFNTALSLGAAATLSALKLDKNGKILAFGYYNGTKPDLFLARLNPDLSLDSTFADNGQWLYDSTGFDFSYRIALDNNDRIYLLCSTYDAGLEVIRLKANGVLDTKFHQQGRVRRSAYAVDIGIDNHNSIEKLILVGSVITADNHNQENALWRVFLD